MFKPQGKVQPVSFLARVQLLSASYSQDRNSHQSVAEGSKENSTTSFYRRNKLDNAKFLTTRMPKK